MNDIAVKLKEMLELVDSSAFPEKAFLAMIDGGYPHLGQPQLGFASVVEYLDKGFYFIFSGGLQQYFELGKECQFHGMIEPDDPMHGKGAVYWSEQELLMAVAVHEVRHRVQLHLKVPLISKFYTDKIERCRRWGELQDRHYKNIPGGDQEFDAKFFEFYGANEVRRTRLETPEQIKNLLHMTPHQILAREKKGSRK